MKKFIFYSLLSICFCLLSLTAWSQNGSDEGFPLGAYEAPEWTVTFADDGTYQVALMDGSSISGSYEVNGDQVKIKDTNCGDTVGTYTWKLEEGELTIQPIQDDCYERKDASGVIMRKVEG